MTALQILIGLVAGSFIAVVVMCVRAPEGYETDEGFFYGREPGQ